MAGWTAAETKRAPLAAGGIELLNNLASRNGKAGIRTPLKNNDARRIYLRAPVSSIK
jgi:hypothetical protein